MSNPANFQAGIVIDQDPLIKESGRLDISGASLVFTNDNRTISFPASGIKIDFGGTAKRLAYISHPSYPGVTLNTGDFSLFKNEIFRHHDEAQNFRNDTAKHRMVFGAVFLMLALILGGSFYLVFFEKNFLASRIARAIPPSYEIALGRKIYDLQFSRLSLDDADIQNELEALATPLLETAEADSPYDIELHIVQDDTVNAFALPGGQIIILSGLIEKTETPDELLGVIAHEIGHVEGRHSLKQMIHSLGSRMLLALFGLNGDEIFGFLSDQAYVLSSRGYSRQQELEADQRGLAYLTDSHIAPQGMVSFFHKMHKEDEKRALSGILSGPLAMLSTHPATDIRIENLKDQAALSHKDNFNAILFDYESFKENLKNLIHSKEEKSYEIEN